MSCGGRRSARRALTRVAATDASSHAHWCRWRCAQVVNDRCAQFGRSDAEERARHGAAGHNGEPTSMILWIILGMGRGYLGVQDHPKELADVVEALIGGVFLDTGFNLVKTYEARF